MKFSIPDSNSSLVTQEPIMESQPLPLTADMTIDQFRKEAQFRVVRFSLHSKPNRELVRFSERHSNPAFKRIVAEKMHSQRQGEHYPPSFSERLCRSLSHGSLREIATTLTLVV